MLMRRWTPPSQVPISSLDTDTNHQTHRTRLRWCKIIISVLIPLILLSFCIVYTLQKQTLFNKKYQYEQNNDYEKQQQLLFHTYISDISNILLKINEKNSLNDKYLHYIQIKTLILLKNLDIKYKKDILLFLYQQKLIQNNQINLHTANFNHLELICPYNFPHLYLSGIQWSNGFIINCHLTYVNLNRANLFNTYFINSTILNGSFIETNLDHSQFIQTIILHTNFNSASLIQSNIFQIDILKGNNFTNADLYQAKFNEEQNERKNILENSFNHARYPNGSFQLLNSNQNLIINGDAEICSFDNQTIWKTMDYNMTLVSEKNEEILNNTNTWGICSFVSLSKIRVYQYIDLYSYSLLIDTNNAEISFSAFANCNSSLFEIHIYRLDGIVHDFKIYSKSTEDMMIQDVNKIMYRYGNDHYHLPIHTRSIQIYFGVDIDMKCYFDNITLTIQQK